ncbi:glycosyl transferase family 1 [Betaproteobacteria bacterium GR16-43]|nr:glycosyl transferase family 1 [Betaproteobacteria bacterium GR16-43]
MKILHTESSLGWGGQEIRVLTEARGVARAGHEVLLAAPVESRIHGEAKRFGVEAVALPIGRKGVTGLAALRRLLGQSAFDVVNTHSSTDSWLSALARATSGSKAAIVRTRHISASVPRNATTRWLYRQADRIVTTGEKLRLQVIEEAAVAPDLVVSVPTGIDLACFHPGERAAARAATQLPADALVVGIVATLRSWKGHRYLIEAIAAMHRADVRLVVVGDGPQREALEALARERHVPAVFAGNQDDVAPWLQALDLFCLPSYANEGVPQALMQAMACGLPVITTDVGSIGEIVTDGVTGLLVTPQDAAALRSAIEALLGDADRRRALGESAAARARERFGEALMVERMIAAFETARSAKR